MMETKDNFKELREDIQLIENKLEHINSTLRKLSDSIYSVPERVKALNYKNIKLSKDISEIKQAVKEEYVEFWLIDCELKNIKEETESLEVTVQNIIDKYYSK